MHALQPKHFKLKSNEVTDLLGRYNISLSQLPKIKIDDPALPENCNLGEVVRIERKEGKESREFFRVIIA